MATPLPVNKAELIAFVEELLGGDLKAFYEGRATASRGYKLQPGQIWAESPRSGIGSHFADAKSSQLGPWITEGHPLEMSRKEKGKLMESRKKFGFKPGLGPATPLRRPVGIGVQLEGPMKAWGKIGKPPSAELTRFGAAHETGHAVDALKGASKKDMPRFISMLRSMVETEAKRNPEMFTKTRFEKGQQTFKWMDRGRHQAGNPRTGQLTDEFKAGGKYFDKAGNVRPEMLKKISAREVLPGAIESRRSEKFADKFAIKEMKRRGLTFPTPKELQSGAVFPSRFPEWSAHGARPGILKNAKIIPLLLLASLMGVGVGAGSGA